MKIAKISFSIGLLENMLPSGSKIVSVQQNDIHHTIDAYIEHESFTEVPKGELAPMKQLVAERGTHIAKVYYAS